MRFGATVRTRRAELGIGLNDFALRLGVSSGYWSRVERGHEKPPRDDLIERARQDQEMLALAAVVKPGP